MKVLEILIVGFGEKAFYYEHATRLARGVCVLIPFNGRDRLGVVLAAHEDHPNDIVVKNGLKQVKKVLDQQPFLQEELLGLCEFVAKYYHHPLGQVIKASVFNHKGQLSNLLYELTNLGKKERKAPSPVGVFLSELFPRSKATNKALRLRWHKIRGQNPFVDDKAQPLALAETLQHIEKIGLVDLHRQEQKLATARVLQEASAFDAVLTKEQEIALEAIMQNSASCLQRKPILLQGVTGSGKTLLYIKTIANLLRLKEQEGSEKDAQALVLVPEIALTDQMTASLLSSFPGRVALVHSAMEQKRKEQEYLRIQNGEVAILIGPRSAIFAPFANLQLIIIDEEHDTSYKQTTGLCYHARDVAVVRAKLAKANIILGSATPSLETLLNAKNGRYHHLFLTKRASGLVPKAMEIIKTTANRPYFSSANDSLSDSSLLKTPIIEPQILTAIEETLALNEQVLVLVARRGFSYYLLDARKNEAVTCPSCSISLTLHQVGRKLICHYCGLQKPLAAFLQDDAAQYFLTAGFGSQKIELFLKKKFSQAQVARLDSDVTQKKGALAKTLADFRQGHINILVGTQILAKGHDFANLTLTVLLEMDQVIDLPDFRAKERAFQLLVQAAGRSGRGTKPGRVLLQSQKPENPLLDLAARFDFDAFAASELSLRANLGYPPFSRLILFGFSASYVADLHALEPHIKSSLHKSLLVDEDFLREVKVVGPYIPALEKIRGRYRLVLLLTSKNNRLLHKFTKTLRFNLGRLGSKIRLLIDVDPISLL